LRAFALDTAPSRVRASAMNALRLLTGDVAARGLAFVALILGARALGPGAYGDFVVAYTAVGVGLILADMGLTPLVLRSVSRRNAIPVHVFWSAAVLNLGASLGIYLALTLGFLGLGHEAWPTMAILGLMLPLQALASSFDASLIARGRLGSVAIARVTGNVCLLGVAVAGLHTHPDPTMLGTAFVTASLVKCGTSAALAGVPRRAGSVRLSIAPVILRLGLPFFLAALFAFLYQRADVLILDIFEPNERVGEYAAAYRVVDALILVPVALAYAVFPNWQRGSGSLRDAPLLLSGSFVVGTAAATLVVLNAGGLVGLLFGDEYRDAVGILQVLAVSIPIFYLDVLLVWLAYAYGRERGVASVGAVAASSNIALNFILIPRFGAYGAAVVTVVTELLVLVCYMSLFRNELRPYRRRIARDVSCAAGVASGVCAAGVIGWLIAGRLTGTLCVFAALAAAVGISSAGVGVRQPRAHSPNA